MRTGSVSEPRPAIAGPAAALLIVLALALLVPGPQGTAHADDVEMRDPLQPPQPPPRAQAAPSINPANWQLASTLVADGRRVAIINGQITGPGEAVDGARVLDVGPGRVRLRAGGQEFHIHSSTPTIRKSSQGDSGS